jgi:hypothetical protein
LLSPDLTACASLVYLTAASAQGIQQILDQRSGGLGLSVVCHV